jgi:phospholipid/cholesterol/gamma-HCH transport system substrate-binding protein
MRRLVAIALTLAATAGLLIASAATGADDPYEVRAILDNGAFLVPGEEVRIAGAKVGEVVEVDVSREDEIVSLEDGPEAIPGKAVIVMTIDNQAFQDFREDASCIARPQSLLGERFMECEHTQPRSAASEPPPPLEEIADGEPGAGQYLLPLENNGKAVDLDLVQNINRRPYAERFRLILNDLGAGFAARGDELAEIIERSNPALRELNEVLAILAEQNRTLAELATDSDEALAPLAREKDALVGFIQNANEVNQASAEFRTEIEAGLEKFPQTLRELRSTMTQLDRFSTEATPVVHDLGVAAPDLVRASEALGPFSDAATTSLTTLGDAAEGAGPKLVASDPLILDLRTLARATKPAARSLAELLGSLKETEGMERFMDLIYYTANGLNGFDSLGHYLRALLLVTNCVDYRVTPLSGCSANWFTEGESTTPRLSDLLPKDRKSGGAAGALEAQPGETSEIPLPGPAPAPEAPEAPESPVEPIVPPAAEPPATPAPVPDADEAVEGGATGEQALRTRMRAARTLLDFLMENGA